MGHDGEVESRQTTFFNVRRPRALLPSCDAAAVCCGADGVVLTSAVPDPAVVLTAAAPAAAAPIFVTALRCNVDTRKRKQPLTCVFFSLFFYGRPPDRFEELIQYLCVQGSVGKHCRRIRSIQSPHQRIIFISDGGLSCAKHGRT